MAQRFNLSTPEILLEPPKVVGEVELALMGFIRQRYSTSGSNFGDLPGPIQDELTPLLRLFSAYTGSSENVIAIVDTKVVEPAQTQRPRHWHTDSVGGLIVVDEMPTEFLVGTLKTPSSRGEAAETVREGLRNIHLYSSDLRPMDRFSEEELEELGLRVDRPKPMQLVEFQKETVHRSPTNSLSESVARTFIQLTFGPGSSFIT